MPKGGNSTVGTAKWKCGCGRFVDPNHKTCKCGGKRPTDRPRHGNDNSEVRARNGRSGPSKPNSNNKLNDMDLEVRNVIDDIPTADVYDTEKHDKYQAPRRTSR